MIFVKNDDLYVKCNGCGLSELVYRNQTDHLLVHDWIHKNGWQTLKLNGKWHNLCPDCKDALRRKKRAEYMSAI